MLLKCSFLILLSVIKNYLCVTRRLSVIVVEIEQKQRNNYISSQGVATVAILVVKSHILLQSCNLIKFTAYSAANLILGVRRYQLLIKSLTLRGAHRVKSSTNFSLAWEKEHRAIRILYIFILS